MRRVKLTQGYFALVDDDDYEWVACFKWCVSWSNKWKCYATRKVKNAAGKWTTCYMHRYLMQPGPGLVTDHADSDGLNNQRYNLENVTEAVNATRHRRVMGQDVEWQCAARLSKRKKKRR